MKEIKRGQSWIYKGGKIDRGEVHFVVKANNQEVITWGTKNSWLSSPDEFLENFELKFDTQ